jgi:predicted regulator of Ras-like GTPase activity (Roadblock/LC7/MglB family)
VAAWTKNPAPVDMLTVMGATGQASVSSIVEALGGASPQDIFVEAGSFRIFIAKLDEQLTLLLVAATPLEPNLLRTEAERLLRALRASLPVGRGGPKGPERKRSADQMPIRTE